MPSPLSPSFPSALLLLARARAARVGPRARPGPVPARLVGSPRRGGWPPLELATRPRCHPTRLSSPRSLTRPSQGLAARAAARLSPPASRADRNNCSIPSFIPNPLRARLRRPNLLLRSGVCKAFRSETGPLDHFFDPSRCGTHHRVRTLSEASLPAGKSEKPAKANSAVSHLWFLALHSFRRLSTLWYFLRVHLPAC